MADLIQQTNAARVRVIARMADVSDEAGVWSPQPGAWSIAEVLEHLVLAELAGLNRMWRAAVSARAGTPEWDGDPVHRGKPIEQVVAETWREKEIAPDVAAPRWGGPAAYWEACLAACAEPLEMLGDVLNGLDLETVIYPHPISGPLDARQRLEFLRFHLDRHAGQLDRIIQAPGFPFGDRHGAG